MSEESTAVPENKEAGIEPWWRRSPTLAAGAALLIAMATLWFGNMLGRVPLDQHSTIGYLLMLPMLLIVPAFSAVALRLCWLAATGSTGGQKILVSAIALVAAAVSLLAIARFGTALLRIFSA